jgi:outer membrane biosynthesis protein TonB
VARSYSWSLLVHSFLFLALLLGIVLQSDELPPADESKVVVRPMELIRPEKPSMQAGSLAQPEPNPEPSPTDPPVPTQPLPKPLNDSPEPMAPHPAPSDKTDPAAAANGEPQFLIETPEYPTYQPNNDGQGTSGADSVNLKGEASLKDRPAVPYYHPAVTLEGVVGRDWILVRFEVEANGTFKVEMLEGTGNIHQDARVLNVLRRWKWLPMQIDGQQYRSIEVVRLYRRDVGRG